MHFGPVHDNDHENWAGSVPRSGVVDTPDHAELAGCLRAAVTAMELLQDITDRNLLESLPGLPALIERSKAALKEYDGPSLNLDELNLPPGGVDAYDDPPGSEPRRIK